MCSLSPLLLIMDHTDPLAACYPSIISHLNIWPKSGLSLANEVYCGANEPRVLLACFCLQFTCVFRYDFIFQILARYLNHYEVEVSCMIFFMRLQSLFSIVKSRYCCISSNKKERERGMQFDVLFNIFSFLGNIFARGLR